MITILVLIPFIHSCIAHVTHEGVFKTPMSHYRMVSYLWLLVFSSCMYIFKISPEPWLLPFTLWFVVSGQVSIMRQGIKELYEAALCGAFLILPRIVVVLRVFI